MVSLRKIKHLFVKNALKQRAVNVYATVKQTLSKNSAWYAHILFYLAACMYACTGASAKAKISVKEK